MPHSDAGRPKETLPQQVFSVSAPPRDRPVVEGGDHLIEVGLLIVEVADVAALKDIEPDRPDVEIVVSGEIMFFFW